MNVPNMTENKVNNVQLSSTDYKKEQKKSRREGWVTIFERGQILSIQGPRLSRNGYFYIVAIKTAQNKIKKYQAWDTAAVQLQKELIEARQFVEFFAYPSYWEEKVPNRPPRKHISYKTKCFLPAEGGTWCQGLYKIESRWLKTTSLGIYKHQFTVSPACGEGLVVHCVIDKRDAGMRMVQYEDYVEIIGQMETVDYNGSDRMVLYVNYIGKAYGITDIDL